jgi:hypothetical protein
MNNKKMTDSFNHILGTYNKKIKDEKDKKQFKYTLSKYIFFIAVLMFIFQVIYFNNSMHSIVEGYFIFANYFLFFVSSLIFLNAFIGVDKSCEYDDDIYFDDD